MRSLVTGAAGFVGSHLVEELLRRGGEVTCLVRTTTNRRWLASLPVRYVVGDVASTPEALPDAVAGQDYVFHLAGVIKAPDAETYRRANVWGTKQLLEACLAAGQARRGAMRRVVLVSSLAAAGPAVDRRPLREGDTCRPVSWYGQSKMEAEELGRTYGALVPLTVVRPPVVYGPRDRDGLLYFRAVACGLRPLLTAEVLLSLVHVRDLVDGLLRAAGAPAAAGQTYYLANAEPISLADLAWRVGQAIGGRSVPVPLPPGAVWAAAALAELGAWLVGRRTIFNRDKAQELLARYWLCSPARAGAELNWQPRVPLDAGLRETAAWYRAQGWL